MSGHEHERLSAYLDDALTPAERAQVAAHLGACGECAARLAELAAVDAAVRTAPSEAPAGYFESFPARLRTRLEPKARPRRLPVWTWAAAAALLLAVVTPLTLLRRPDERAGMASPAREVPAATAPLAKAQARSDAGAPTAAEPKPETPAQRPVPVLAAPQPAKRESAFASPPGEADASAARQPAAPAVAQSVAPAPPVAAREEEAAAALADTGAMAESVTSEARNQAKASADRKTDAPRDAAAATSSDESAPGRARAAATGAGSRAGAKLVSAEAEWQRLDTARPRALSEWRRLREDWRRFAARDPGGPQADEARVRTIEAGYEAWRSGGERADEELFRSDAASYLQRDDAVQKERVERLLR